MQHGGSVVSLAALSASSSYYGHEPTHHGGSGSGSSNGGGSGGSSGGSHSPGKYQENGHDTFSDFVTLVCQEAQNTQNSVQVLNQPSGRGSMKLLQPSSSSYYSTNMLPPPPPPVMARPVAIIRSTGLLLRFVLF